MLAFTIAICGCTTTDVKKNPGQKDKGVRYYRPKPYLLVQPSAAKPTEFVQISLEYLPDFSEEYSIRVRAGLGVNKTKITLKDGWNLTQLDAELDSQTDENINAAANLIKALPELAKLTSSGETKAPRMEVKANNVPLGYYESVITQDQECRKHLCGWRYIGFAPFSPCCMDGCNEFSSQVLYGLHVVDNTLTFTPLHDIANLKVTATGTPSQNGVIAATEFISKNEVELKKSVVKVFQQFAGMGFVPTNATFAHDSTLDNINVNVEYPKQWVINDQNGLKETMAVELNKLANSLSGNWKFKIVLSPK